jgi:hypothetical protein
MSKIKKKRRYQIGFRIAPSPSNKHGIWLSIDGFNEQLISAHDEREAARYGANMCRQCLATFGDSVYFQHQKNWFGAFMNRLVGSFDYADDAIATIATTEELKTLLGRL